MSDNGSLPLLVAHISDDLSIQHSVSLMKSSCKSDRDTLKPISSPETVLPDVQPRIDEPCSASWHSNVVSNSAAKIPQIHNEPTESASHWRSTFANIGNKGTSVYRRLRDSCRKHVGASDQQSPREPRPSNPDGLPTTIVAPVSSRTIPGHGDTSGLDVDLVSRPQGGQVSP